MKVIAVIALLMVMCSAQITSPANCDRWYAGFPYDIEWNSSQFGAQVDLDLYADGRFILNIATTTNDGSFEWDVPFATNYSLSTCTAYVVIQTVNSNDVQNSSNFTISNPVTFGTIDRAGGSNVADTIVKVRWSGETASSYDIEYRKGSNGNSKTVTVQNDRKTGENMQDYVISNLDTDTEYQYRMRYRLTSSSDKSDWTDWQVAKTFEELDCGDDLVAAFFALEVYDNIRTGDKKYPGFCGDWETVYALEVSPDFVAVYADSKSKRVVVSYRGTTVSQVDFTQNLGILVPCQAVVNGTSSTCNVNSGIAGAYATSTPATVLGTLQNLFGDDYMTLIVTGHSQGGSISLVASLDFSIRFANSGVDIKNINFGTPMIGDDGFSDDVLAIIPSVTIYVQKDSTGTVDEATTLPESAAGFLPDYLTTGFVTINQDPFYLPCTTSNPNCIGNGAGPFPPYYCHCIVGYYTNIALLHENPNNSPASSGSPASSNNSPSSRSPASGSGSSRSSNNSSGATLSVAFVFVLAFMLMLV